MPRPCRGIHGVVADLLDVPKEYETAIETALGGSIQNVVTDSEETAKILIGHLKKEPVRTGHLREKLVKADKQYGDWSSISWGGSWWWTIGPCHCHCQKIPVFHPHGNFEGEL